MLEISYESNLIGDYWYFNLKGDVTDEDIDMLFYKLTNLVNQNCKFRFVADSSELDSISLIKASKGLYNWMYNERDAISVNLLSSALIINNDIIRDLINGVFFIIPPISPTKICSTLYDGLKFIFD